jgi:hypothetical protein
MMPPVPVWFYALVIALVSFASFSLTYLWLKRTMLRNTLDAYIRGWREGQETLRNTALYGRHSAQQDDPLGVPRGNGSAAPRMH